MGWSWHRPPGYGFGVTEDAHQCSAEQKYEILVDQAVQTGMSPIDLKDKITIVHIQGGE